MSNGFPSVTFKNSLLLKPYVTEPFPVNPSPTPTLIFLPLLKPTKHIPSAWISFLRDSHLICFHVLFRFLLKEHLLRKALPVSPHCLPMDKLTFSLSLLPHFVFFKALVTT